MEKLLINDIFIDNILNDKTYQSKMSEMFNNNESKDFLKEQIIKLIPVFVKNDNSKLNEK